MHCIESISKTKPDMKRIFLVIVLLMMGQLLFAQGENSHNATPKAVYNLGANPEFVFLRNLSTPEQVLTALNSDANWRKYPRQMKELNRLLKKAGFENGTKGVTLASISAVKVEAGTKGHMGSGNLRYSYSKMEGKPKKAWKLSSDDGRYITFFSACGNAFYANNFGAETSNSYTGNCKQLPANVSSESREITVNELPLNHTTKKTYVYYKKDGCGCRDCDDMGVAYDRSKPLLIKEEDIAVQVPQTYTITTTGTGTATVCKGKTMDVRADISVEKESTYLGYSSKPAVTKVYKEVTKRDYKRLERMKKRSEL
jgi:hypothetical protein